MAINGNVLLELGATYQHLGNGYFYKILHHAQDESNNPMVIHQGLHDGRVWVRSDERFLERFKKVSQ